jgi:transcriptional regulator, lysR family
VDFYQTWGPAIHIEHHEGTVEEITDHVHQGISEVGIVYVAKKQTGTFQHILSHKKLEFIPQSEKSICVYVGPNHPLYHADSVDFSDLPCLKFIRGVRDFFSMEHHLETVSMGVIDPGVMKHVVYSNSDHLVTNFLLHTDVCSLGLNFMYRPYEQYDIKPLAINGCEPFLQIGYVRTPERPLSPQARWLTDRFGEMLQGYELQL